MASNPDLKLRYPELGSILRAKRLALGMSGGEISSKIFGDKYYTWKIFDLEKGIVRSTTEALDTISTLINFYRISPDEKRAIDFDSNFAKIGSEVNRRLSIKANPVFLPITRPSRYAPRP